MVGGARETVESMALLLLLLLLLVEGMHRHVVPVISRHVREGTIAQVQAVAAA